VLERTLSGYVASHLCLSDRVLAWLAYIHLLEFQRPPTHLFDPADSTCSTIVNKVGASHHLWGVTLLRKCHIFKIIHPILTKLSVYLSI